LPGLPFAAACPNIAQSRPGKIVLESSLVTRPVWVFDCDRAGNIDHDVGWRERGRHVSGGLGDSQARSSSFLQQEGK